MIEALLILALYFAGAVPAAAAKGALPAAEAAAPPPDKTAQVISYGRFGKVTVYRPRSPTHAVLFLSGDGGWNQGVIDMARLLYKKDYLVIGIDVPRYLRSGERSKESCLYPPADLQGLAQGIQKRLGVKRYLKPLLVGYSSGATLAYAALVAAPAGTFDGALSLGFCPDIESKKPLCKGDGLVATPRPRPKDGKTPSYDLAPHHDLPALWVVLHGRSDQVCSLQATSNFVSATGSGRLVPLDRVGHGFGVKKRWQFEYERAVRDLTAAAFVHPPKINSVAPAPGDEVSVTSEDIDLPLIEVKPPIAAPRTDYLAVLVSGDGGWAGLDRDVAGGLSDAGIPVIGLDSLQYFWSEKPPARAAADLQRLLTYYGHEWQKPKILLIGYSFGADVLPFMASRLSQSVKQRIAAVALISATPKATFEFQVANWFSDDDREGSAVEPEIARLAPLPVLCFYGKEDRESLCPRLRGGVQVVALGGGHRLGDGSDDIVARLLKTIGVPPPE